MPAPNLFLIYVRDAEAATAFYSDLFEIEPTFTSPRYVAFELAPGVLFALWSGRSEHAVPSTPRTSEVGLMVPGPASVVDDIYAEWVEKGARGGTAPYDGVLCRTILVGDRGGNTLRVAP